MHQCVQGGCENQTPVILGKAVHLLPEAHGHCGVPRDPFQGAIPRGHYFRHANTYANKPRNFQWEATVSSACCPAPIRLRSARQEKRLYYFSIVKKSDS